MRRAGYQEVDGEMIGSLGDGGISMARDVELDEFNNPGAPGGGTA